MSKEFLAEVVHHRTYAKYLPEEWRRETTGETIDRNCQMHVDKFPHLKAEIEEAYQSVHGKFAVPSMRSFQFGGEAIVRRPVRGYNCAFTTITKVKDLADLFFMSMSGVGVGYSVQNRHVSQLPPVPHGYSTLDWIIPDSAEGWADSILMLFDNPDLHFIYDEIRPMGAALSTGGTASGPKALIKMHSKVREILRKAVGRQLTSFEVHRIACFIADCVVVGGVRRGALISLFDVDDNAMMTCKAGDWWKNYPELARSNNSAVIHREDPDIELKIRRVVQACFAGGQAEPGIYLTNDYDMGTNPCCEIALRSHQHCNLTEVNVARCLSKEQLFKAVRDATIIGTLQASYTNFSYVSPAWQQNDEDEALLGVSLTGQAENQAILTDENMAEAAAYAVEVNREWAAKLGIKPAARICTTKPSGTASSWLGTTPGVHAGHAIQYLRRVRMDRHSPLAKALIKHFGAFVVSDPFNQDDIVLQIPIEMYDTTLLRDQETALQCLERVKRLYVNWILGGHVSGKNTHNVSLTINYHEHEKGAIIEWMVENRNFYNGISLIPYDGGDYQYLPYSQPPHPEVFQILKQTFAELAASFDFKKILEKKDNTDFKGEAACAGGACTLDL